MKSAEAYWPGAPDLAVEVLSPGDRPSEVDEKVRAWLDGGAAAVSVVHPALRRVTIHSAAGAPQVLNDMDVLDEQDALPGFQCAVASIFDEV